MFPNEQVSEFLSPKDYYPDVYAEIDQIIRKKVFCGWD